MKESKIAVIGIGNILMSDEGVGCHAANLLLAKYNFEPSIEILDAGTTGTDLLHYFEDYDRIIITDAVNFDKEPGFIGTIEDDDILARITTKMSMHHLGLSDVLSTVKLLGIETMNVYLVGIQPASLEVGTELTDLIAQRMDRMIEVVLLKLKEWGVSVKEQ